MTEIYQEGEEEQKRHALRYVQTLQHVMKSKSHLWNEIKPGTYSKSYVQGYQQGITPVECKFK